MMALCMLSLNRWVLWCSVAKPGLEAYIKVNGDWCYFSIELHHMLHNGQHKDVANMSVFE